MSIAGVKSYNFNTIKLNLTRIGEVFVFNVIKSANSMVTLSIDIGGSHIKTSTLDENGKLIAPYNKLETPGNATPEAVISVIKKLANGLQYDRVSAGFPGYVRDGIVHTAPNLGNRAWDKINFAQMLSNSLGKPARVVNDADLLGLGVISGKGLEMMITLGTGFGTALYLDGKLLPHLELAHHPIKKKKTYDEYLGEEARKHKGNKKWVKRLKYVLDIIKIVFNYDTLYIGGGNSRFIDFTLPDNIKIVTNVEGIDGGVKLWK